MFLRPSIKVKSINVQFLALILFTTFIICMLLWKQKSNLERIHFRCLEANSALRLSTDPGYRIFKTYSDSFFTKLNNSRSKECQLFRRFMNFDELPVTEAEKKFPLAFAIAVYKDIGQVARLLRIIHRTHNFYVIHVDRNSEQLFFDLVNGLSTCFGKNVAVILREKSVRVKWFSYTVLQMELIMMRKLLSMGKWNYFINLTGQELPLKTNLELVRALAALNGSNLVEGTVKHRNLDRIPSVNLTFPVTWIKGGVHAVLLREFVKFSIFNTKAIEILAALEKYSYYKCPDEQFFATLAFNPQLGIPGACLKVYEADEPDTDPKRLHLMVREKLWYGENCPTKTVRGICIFGTPSLPTLLESKALAANKFHADYFPAAYDCLEYTLNQRAKEGYTSDTTLYANRYCSKEHI